MFQINNLDKLILLRKNITRNKYQNISILLFGFIFLMLTSGAFYISLDPSIEQIYESYCYLAPILCIAIEILLFGEISTQLAQKFSIINTKIHTETILYQKFQNSKPSVEVETQKAKVIARKITALMEMHNHLSSVSRKLNTVFGLPAFIIVAANFYIATITLYYILQLLAIPLTTISTFQLMASVAWSTLMLIEILILANIFEIILRRVSI